MPNTLAYMALISWPLICVFIYGQRRLSNLTATFLAIVGGYLLLPVRVQIDLPLIPALDQTTIPAISAAACCIVIRKIPIKLLPEGIFLRILFLALLLAPFLSVVTNAEPVYNGMEYLPGLRAYDAVAEVTRMYLILLPLLIGQSIIKKPEQLTHLLKLLLIAALIYSPLIIFEVQAGPRIHTWLYGFFPHAFEQQVRFGGFRPVVFLGHGLLVAIFIAVTFCASAILWKQDQRIAELPKSILLLYMLILLLICKSVGAWILGIATALCLLILPSGSLITFSAIMSMLVMAYPLLTLSGIFPDQLLVDLGSLFGDERAKSLAFRFFHEERLLNHATEKLAFGWGGWGRNRLYDSISDGYWIIVIGKYGLLGFLSMTGLILAMILRARYLHRLIPERGDRAAYSGLVTIIALLMIDQIPNSSLSPYFWLTAGGVLGVSRQLQIQLKILKMNVTKLASPCMGGAVMKKQ